MKTHARNRGRSSAAGLSLLEMSIALAMIVIVLVGSMFFINSTSRSMRSRARIVSTSTRSHEMISRLEKELVYARGYTPSTVLAAALGGSTTALASVSTTRAFPDRGMLLIDRGTPKEERLLYDGFDPVTPSFLGLTRGVQCTSSSDHAEQASVLWAGTAKPIVNQTNPPPETYDGQASELAGPIYFQGDGTGFCFQVPTDPAGGVSYVVNGELTWGATVAGQHSPDGWSVIHYDPETTVTEAELRIDLNRDEDMDDTFDVGALRMRSWIGTDAGRPVQDLGLCPAVVLQEQCNWGGDLDGDGFDDPIFLWDPDARSLHVRLTVLNGEVKDRGVVNPIETWIYLRNDPQ